MLRYVKYKYQSGIILITVLIFFQLFAILSLYALNVSLLAKKTSRRQWQHYELMNAAESLLKEAEARLLIRASACLISEIKPEELIDRPLEWWKSVSCAGNFRAFQYYYVVEFLGEETCADIESLKTTADYFRITLLVTSVPLDRKIILQSTVVTSDPDPHQCNGIHREVDIGRQSWRELRKG